MVETAFSKALRVGRATALTLGVAVMLALTVGMASAALGANGKPFLLGKRNVASAVSTLVKQGPGPALRLLVRPGQPPMVVNSQVKVPNLNADKLDGQHSSAFLPAGGTAANADRVDGKHANELSRIGQISTSQSLTLQETEGGTGQVLVINAPAAGFVRVNGDVSAAPTATAPCAVSATNGCYFGAKIRHVESGTDSQTSQDSVVGSFARGNVAMDAVFPVNAGNNRFIIVVFRSPGGSGTLQVTSAQLTAEYTPYGSTGAGTL